MAATREANVSRELDIRRATALRLLRDGAVTFVVLLLVFAAFDDITTDNSTTFAVEYTFLLASAVWLGFVVWRLLRARHYVLGGVSLLALAGALWGQRAIRPGILPGFWPEYVIVTAAYMWFLALSFVLIWRGWREHPEKERQTV
jgi:hypothetical protein